MRWQRKKELGAEHKQGADAGRCASLQFLQNGLKGHFLWYIWQRFDFGEIDDLEKHQCTYIVGSLLHETFLYIFSFHKGAPLHTGSIQFGVNV